MTGTKYIGMDVHKESISIAVRNSVGKVVMECVIETKASMILQLFDGLRGDLHVTFEEGTWAAWLYDLLKPHVTKLVVCDPRLNALLQDGNQNDRVDARKLSDLLYLNKLSAVYHGDHGLRTLKELGRSYLTITRDQSRVMTRVKAMYRSWAIPCSGKQVYGSRHRAEWLAKIHEPGVRRRAELYYQQLDALRTLRQEVRRDLLAESKKHKVWKRLCEIPSIGPIRAAELLGILQTPHRFRTKRQLWTYCGLGAVTSSSADHEMSKGQLRRKKKHVQIRGLNENYNHDLKDLFKGAAVGTDRLRRKEAMKTAERRTSNSWTTLPGNRAHGVEDQNSSCSNTWAAKQKEIQPMASCFFLTSPFMATLAGQLRSKDGFPSRIRLALPSTPVCHLSVDQDTNSSLSSNLRRTSSNLF